MHEAYLEAGITEAAPGDLVAEAECLIARGAPGCG
jgi:hypothetical protein